MLNRRLVSNTEFPKYLASRLCSKCGYTDISTTYCGKAIEDFPNLACVYIKQSQISQYEHLHRACLRCRYSWVTRIIEEQDDEVEVSIPLKTIIRLEIYAHEAEQLRQLAEQRSMTLIGYTKRLLYQALYDVSSSKEGI